MNVSVATGSLLGSRRTLDSGNELFEIRNEQCQALRFGAERKQFLLEIEIEGQRSGEIKRDRGGVGGGKILPGPGQSQQLRMQGGCAVRILLWRRSRFVLDHHNFRPQKRSLLINLENLEAASAFGHEIKPAIFVFFHHGNNFRRAPDVSQPLLNFAHYAERAILRQTFANHFLVTGLENVQRQGRARE